MGTRLVKAAKYEIQKTSTCRATLFRCKFWSMFPVFHLAWSTWSATETSVAGRRNAALWLVDLPEREQICCAPSCEFDQKRATKPKFVAQSRLALYFSQQLSSTRNKCFCCETSWLRTAKNGIHRPKLATKQCCATSWGFLFLVFRRLEVYVKRHQNTISNPHLYHESLPQCNNVSTPSPPPPPEGERIQVTDSQCDRSLLVSSSLP